MGKYIKPLRAYILSPLISFSCSLIRFGSHGSHGMSANTTHPSTGPAKPDPYNQPSLALADAAFFQGLHTIVQDLLIQAGGAEVLLDSILTLGEKLKAAHPRAELVVEEGCSHVDFILEVMLGYRGLRGSGRGRGRERVEGWVGERVGGG